MAKKDVQDSGRRGLIEEIARDIGGFFRKSKREPHAPSAREQELTTEVEELKASISAPEPTTEPIRTPKSRPATGLEPELIFIGAGRFTMGSDKTLDPQAFNRELPQHQVYVGDFYIAKYPVTNAEYKRFVDATGHRKPYHWQSEDHESFGGADQPVVCVSWRDATAYCQWLSKITGKSYRLPTEAEWEKAARGPDRRIYPWGNEWDAERCNTPEGGPAATTPVAQYSPQGDSPYGVTDMAGNVWEWTQSLYGGYPYDPEDGREDPVASGARALRGGSWLTPQGGARLSFRGDSLPDDFLDLIGFRVCVTTQQD